jgi:hypothetical protein
MPPSRQQLQPIETIPAQNQNYLNRYQGIVSLREKIDVSCGVRHKPNRSTKKILHHEANSKQPIDLVEIYQDVYQDN